jgi:hypothetical protein
MGKLVWWAWRTIVRRVDRDAEEALAGEPPGKPVWGRVLRRGVTDGVLGDSTPWLVLGGVAAVVLVVKRSSANTRQVLLREELRPGQALLITDGMSTLAAVSRLSSRQSAAGTGGGAN